MSTVATTVAPINLHEVFADSPHIIHLRYTLMDESEEPKLMSYVHRIWTWSKHSIDYSTWGYEKLKSHHPHTGLPAKPHIHCHFQVSTGHYLLDETKGWNAYKKALTRHLRQFIERNNDDSLIWGKNRLYICRADPNNTIHSFLYPLKQVCDTDYQNLRKPPPPGANMAHSINWFNMNHLFRGFAGKENDMLSQATSKWSLAKSMAEKSRVKLQDDGMSAFYKGLLEVLDLEESKTELNLYSATLRYYCTKGKPIDDHKIRGYVTLYQLQNELISKENYIKLKYL